MKNPLHGLLLAGGKSTRMGRDKADLMVVDGLSMRDRGMKLLGGVTAKSFLAIAGDDDRQYHHLTIQDLRENAGPMAGLESAFRHSPEAAWLVTACDLPFLTAPTLEYLVESRDPTSDATCFTSRFDGKPEPLCTIYEPSSHSSLERMLSGGVRCARRFLLSLTRKEIELPELSALDNCNRPEDLEEARLSLNHGRTLKNVLVEYCGVLREDAGCDSEEFQTRSVTAAGLWEELRMSRRLSLEIDSVKIAINDEFRSWNQPLTEEDKVTLFPPFAGG
ncbi:MAG: NTP transferase domain-containing protein [Roseibacillus sp.]